MPESKTKKIAMVTGANKGIGREVARELAARGMKVILTARNESAGLEAARELAKEGLEVVFCQLDVSDDASVGRALDFVKREFGRLDVLVNNAGVFLDDPQDGSVFKADLQLIRDTFETNTLGALRMSQAFIPMMQKQRYGRVINVSSGMGQLSEMNGTCPGYRISKTALNAVTRIFSDETSDDGDIQINSVCPGWVRTDMGGPGAERTVEQGADTIVWLATQGADGPRGRFLRDREPVDW